MRYGRYEIIRQLGHGAMSVVYLARDPSIDRMVAVKVLRRDRIENGDTANRLLREAKVIGRLSHPGIVTVYDVGVESGDVYIAMEYLEESLSQVMERKRLDVKEVVQAGAQLAEALAYAHEKGVVHRDVKPGNIMIHNGHDFKLADFGIARLEDGSATLQTLNATMGTPAYMSPEQVQGEKVGCRSDLYSLGVVLYEMSTGTRPFGGKGKTLATVFNEIINTIPKHPDLVAAPVPKELSAVIMKAMHKDPEHRYPSGREMADALRKCLADPRPARPAARRYAFAALAAMLTACCGYGIYKFLPTHALPRPARSASARGKPPAAVRKDLPVSTKGADAVTPAAPLAKAPSVTAAPAATSPAPSNPRPAAAVAAPEPAPAGSAQASSAAKAVPVAGERVPGKPAPKPAKAPAPPPMAAMPPAGIAGPPPLVLPKFAFLKVRSVPEGSRVYIDGTFKGHAPLSIKLKLGEYKVRLSHPGYEDAESKVTLHKMTDYPLRRELRPAGS